MSEFDLHATISRLFVYPIKSCAGVELKQSLLIETGLEFDRAWMVVDEAGEFVSQREFPCMTLIQPHIKQYEMILRAPGMLALHIGLDAVESPCTVRVWDDTCAAYDMGDVAAQWFTDFLTEQRPSHQAAGKLRLVRFDPEHKRKASAKWTKEQTAFNQFSDGYPLLVLSEASVDDLNQRLQAIGEPAVSIERFRPNLVLAGVHSHDEDRTASLHISSAQEDFTLALVKPCSRCSIPNIDPQTATINPFVGQTLQTYRQDARLDGAITFGMNAIVTRPDSAPFDLHIEVGQQVKGKLQF
jgi:uncharacterized protein